MALSQYWGGGRLQTTKMSSIRHVPVFHTTIHTTQMAFGLALNVSFRDIVSPGLDGFTLDLLVAISNTFRLSTRAAGSPGESTPPSGVKFWPTMDQPPVQIHSIISCPWPDASEGSGRATLQNEYTCVTFSAGANTAHLPQYTGVG